MKDPALEHIMKIFQAIIGILDEMCSVDSYISSSREVFAGVLLEQTRN